MKNKLMLVMLLGLFLIGTLGMASASLETLQPATLNQEYTILQTCSDATWINLSVSNTNGLFLVDKEMIYNGTVWTYKFTPDTLGRTDVAYLTDGCEKSNTAYFEVKPINNTGSIVFFIFIYALFYGITLIGLIRKHEWIALGGCFGLLIVGVYTGISGIAEYKSGLTDAISYITILIGIGLGFESLKEITYY